MSQYGRVNPSYYQPIAKFNSTRLIYKYAYFNAFQGVISAFCLFNIIYPSFTGSLTTTNITNSCRSTSSESTAYQGTFNVQTPVINSCELDYVEQPLILTYKSNFIDGTVNNSCSSNSSHTIPSQVTPTPYVIGLFQHTITNHCSYNINYLTTTGSLAPVNVTASCSNASPQSIAYQGNMNIQTPVINSCELDYVEQPLILTYKSNFIDGTITGACRINA